MHTKASYIISLLVLAGVLQAVAVPDIKGATKEQLGAAQDLDGASQTNKRQKSATAAADNNKQQQALYTQSSSLADSSNSNGNAAKFATAVPSETIVEDKRARLSNDKKLEQLMSLLLSELPSLDIASLGGAGAPGDNSKRPEAASVSARQALKGARSTHHQLVYIDNSSYRNEKYTPCFFNAITCFPWIRNRHARSPA